MKRRWWHDKIAYQIYPKSFFDTNGDGIGDLNGITEKLDYLAALGVDVLWLSPVYASPFVDQGYDVSDYRAIAPQFGTMADFDRLLAAAKARHMHIVMDLVANHCSDKHTWFQAALADPYGAAARWFYFVPGKNGGPPSNLRSYFGGSAWERVPGTDLFYLHMFAKEQPDLNWHSAEMKRALFGAVNWWLDKGVAGLRLDAIMNVQKDTRFIDYPPDGPDGLASCTNLVAGQDVRPLLFELRDATYGPRDAFVVAEAFGVADADMADYVGDDGCFSTMFDFGPHCLTFGAHGWYDAKPVSFSALRTTIFTSQMRMQGIGFLANILENHDEPRAVSTFLPPHAQNAAGAAMLGTVSVLLRGLPFLYQGQELGMTNVRFSSIDAYDDVSTKGEYAIARAAGLTAAEALDAVAVHSRDNARTPMQWSSERSAGFTDGAPWLPVNPNYRTINAADEAADSASVLCCYKRLLALRKSPAWCGLFVNGDFAPAFSDVPNVLAYTRSYAGRTALVAANFGAETVSLPLPARAVETLFANMPQTAASTDGLRLTLPPCGACVLALKPADA